MMDPVIKNAWVDALRSGKYKQGVGGLRCNDGCNCCLGVLAEINNVPFRDFEEDTDDIMEFDHDMKVFDFDGKENAYAVPNGYFGLTQDNIENLIELNDNEGFSFDTIADHIEKNF